MSNQGFCFVSSRKFGPLAPVVMSALLVGCGAAPTTANPSKPVTPIASPAPQVIAAPASSAKDRSASARPISGPVLAYPPVMLAMGITGSVDVECRVTVEGFTKDCSVVSSTNDDFAAATFDFVTHARFSPAVRNGAPVEESHHRWTFDFRFNDTPPPQLMPAPGAVAQ